jgi:transcriptional regulator with XRE-family HTH domain
MRHGEQKKIAKWLGVSQVYIHRILKGKKRPSPERAELLSDKSGISFRDWLLLPAQELERKVYLSWKLDCENRQKVKLTK